MPRATTLSRDLRLLTRGAKVFGRVVSVSTANMHRAGWLPGDAAVEVLADFPYTKRGGKQSFDVYRPRGSSPLAHAPLQPFAIHIHGGGWVIGDRKMAAMMGRSLASRGIAVVAPGYRLAPAASLHDQRDDLEGALRAILEAAPRLGLDPTRYAVIGESAGAHLAMRLLQEFPDVQRPRAAVGFYGAYDLGIYRRLGGRVFERFLGIVSRGGDVDTLVQAHHAVRELPFTDVPVLLVHGSADRFVPVRNSAALHELLVRQGVPVELAIYPGAGHGFNYQTVMRPEHTRDSFRRLEAFLHRHLLAPALAPALAPTPAAATRVDALGDPHRPKRTASR